GLGYALRMRSLTSLGINLSYKLLYMFPSKVFSSSFSLNSFSDNDLNTTSDPSAKTASISNTLSRVTPYWIEVVPLELLPTIPPIMQRLDVDVFGPKKRSYKCRYSFSSSLITPGSTSAVFFSLSTWNILVK